MSGALTVADVLEHAAGLIEPEGKWTQLVPARDASGDAVESDSLLAVCWCALGAISASTEEDLFGFEARQALRRVAGIDGIGDWNDAPERTQAEVISKLREAATLARGEQSRDQ